MGVGLALDTNPHAHNFQAMEKVDQKGNGRDLNEGFWTQAI